MGKRVSPELYLAVTNAYKSGKKKQEIMQFFGIAARTAQFIKESNSIGEYKRRMHMYNTTSKAVRQNAMTTAKEIAQTQLPHITDKDVDKALIQKEIAGLKNWIDTTFRATILEDVENIIEKYWHIDDETETLVVPEIETGAVKTKKRGFFH